MPDHKRSSIQTLGVLVLLAGLVAPRSAAAYCPTMGCDESKPALVCREDERGCPANDLPLFWGSSCISYGVHKDGSRTDGISYETAKAAIDSAFSTWLQADCGGGRRPSISVENKGAVDCGRRDYNKRGGNANVFMFLDDHWPYENAPDGLALTTITYDPDTGEIYDADVEINSFDGTLTTSELAPVDDLPSILVHEVGHFFGLAHSQVGEAVMRERYRSGTIELRTLHPDDEAGMCAIYPPERDLPPADCEPRRGFSRECSGEVEEGGCCAVGGARPGGSAPLALLLAGAALIALRRCRATRLTRASGRAWQ